MSHLNIVLGTNLGELKVVNLCTGPGMGRDDVKKRALGELRPHGGAAIKLQRPASLPAYSFPPAYHRSSTSHVTPLSDFVWERLERVGQL